VAELGWIVLQMATGGVLAVTLALSAMTTGNIPTDVAAMLAAHSDGVLLWGRGDGVARIGGHTLIVLGTVIGAGAL